MFLQSWKARFGELEGWVQQVPRSPGRSWEGVSALDWRLEGEMARPSFGEAVWRTSGNNATSTAGRSLEDGPTLNRVPSASV